MVDRTANLAAALRANAALRVQAERLIAAYVAPESERGSIINELMSLFHGPAQREAERLAAEALGEAPDLARAPWVLVNLAGKNNLCCGRVSFGRGPVHDVG
jgi:hypothetical protein